MSNKKRKTQQDRFLRLVAAEKAAMMLRIESEQRGREVVILRRDCESLRVMMSKLISEHSRATVRFEPTRDRYAIQLNITPDMARCMRFDGRAIGSILGDQIVSQVMRQEPTFGSFIDQAMREP